MHSFIHSLSVIILSFDYHCYLIMLAFYENVSNEAQRWEAACSPSYLYLASGLARLLSTRTRDKIINIFIHIVYLFFASDKKQARLS